MKRLFFTLLLLAGHLGGTAQNISFPGATWSFGRSIIHEQLPEAYSYTPISILGNFPVQQFGKVGIYGEYQYTQAINLFNNYDFEFGMNFGLRYLFPINPRTHFIASIGSGPHYITVETDRQASGFIFSDNFELNLRHYSSQLRTTIQLAGRFRHISNAGLKSPNGGIDNFFLLLGLERML